MKQARKNLATVTSVEVLPDFMLRMTFADGEERDFDMRPFLKYPAFAPLREPELFSRAEVDPVAATVCWPGGICMDAEILRGTRVPARYTEESRGREQIGPPSHIVVVYLDGEIETHNFDTREDAVLFSRRKILQGVPVSRIAYYRRKAMRLKVPL